MRKVLVSMAALSALVLCADLANAGGGCADALPSGCDTGGNGCCAGGREACGCRLFGRRHCDGAGIDGLDPFFNCGCGGSYNYPVPPLYTYHWPGMFKQQLMTDYKSPWRFPPLKPYVDEQPMPAADSFGLPQLRPVSALLSHESSTRQSGEIESISSRLERAVR